MASCALVGVLFVDPGLSASDDAVAQVASCRLAVEAAHPGGFVVVLAPAAGDGPPVPLPGPGFFLVAPELVDALRARVGARVALTVPSLFLLARVGDHGLRVVNHLGLPALRRGHLVAEGFPGSWQRGCFQAVLRRGPGGLRVHDSALLQGGLYPGDVVAVAPLVTSAAPCLAYINAPEDVDSDGEGGEGGEDTDAAEAPSPWEVLLPVAVAASLGGVTAGETLTISGPVDAPEADVVCVVQVVASGAPPPEHAEATTVVARVLNPYFGIGDTQADQQDKLQLLQQSLASSVGGGGSVGAGAGAGAASLAWLSKYAVTRQCRFLPVVKGQQLCVEGTWFRVQATEPTGPCVVGPSTTVVCDGVVRASPHCALAGL